MLMQKFKHITIRQVDGEEFADRPMFRILNNKRDSQLGFLCYYKPWKQYVFSGEAQAVFNDECLENVQTFLADLKKRLKEGREI